jgi:DNA-directed RNA polymerase subunit E'/Rpb7
METVKQKLFAEVEGQCQAKYGIVIAVTTIDTIGHGLIQPGLNNIVPRIFFLFIQILGSGFVSYPVKYKAIVFRPFKGQVVDATVDQVNKLGMFCNIGPVSSFVSRHGIPPEYEFEPDSVPPCYKNSDESIVIKPGDTIRLKIMGIRLVKSPFNFLS